MSRATPTPSPFACTRLRAWLWRRCFGISADEVKLERRGFFTGVPGMPERLEKCGGAFVAGYHLALEDAGAAPLAAGLESMPRGVHGFAYEGAAMALALLDRVTPWRRDRFARFLAGPGEPHCYMVNVGAGWAMARLPGNVDRFLARLDPLLRWLAVDGFGFHEGFFHTARYAGGAPAPDRLRGYARRAFDQGLGRCLWFIHGGGAARIAANIERFDAPRRGDLWSGVGLATTYAGEIDAAGLATLSDGAAENRPSLAQGAAFAAKARLRAGNESPYTDFACRALCGMSAVEAAALTDRSLENLPSDAAEPAFELWRQRIQQHFAPLLVP